MSKQKKILIMAGGTGGHVFPGLAVADYLREQGHEVVWLGTHHGLDNKLVPKAKIPLYKVSIRGLRGKGKLGLLLAPFKILRALVESLQIIGTVKPDVILGLGGYVSGPGGIAAWLKRIPLIIHEQNALAGKTNALLTRFATRRLEAFPHSLSKKYKPEWVGNPVRQAICNLSPSEKHIFTDKRPLRLLVFGGSQGAQAVNKVILHMLSNFARQQRPDVWHQVGADNFSLMKTLYDESNAQVKLTAFIDDMAAAYEWADLVICRSGALTVSEIADVGVASILIPFPHAVDDHQTANANFLQNMKAAIIIQEKDLNPEKLEEIINDLSNYPQKLLHMAENARKLAKPRATKTVADICLEEAR